MFKLSIEDDEGKTTVVPLARDEMTVGRLEGNTIRLTERNVSRKHARLSRQNGALFIEDLPASTASGSTAPRSLRRRRCAKGTRSRSATTSSSCGGPSSGRPTGRRCRVSRRRHHHCAAGDRGRPGGDPHPGVGRRDGRAARVPDGRAGGGRPAPFTDETSPPKPMTAVPEAEGAVAEAVEGQPTIPFARSPRGPRGASRRWDRRRAWSCSRRIWPEWRSRSTRPPW